MEDLDSYREIIRKAYAAFNDRNIDGVLQFMLPDVQWPNGWEGGYVEGHNQVREYWQRQWKELNPRVEPVGFTEKEDGQIEVKVHQIIKDIQGNLILDGMIEHVYTFEDGLVKRMEIRKD